MQESRAIALWAVLLGGGFVGGIWLWHDPPQFGFPAPTARVSAPAPASDPALPQPITTPPVPASSPQAAATVPVIEPAMPPARQAVAPPEPALPALAPPRTAEEPRATPPTSQASRRPAPDFPTIPAGPRSGDNAEARRYTDALNALSTEGYSGVDRIVPEGDQFRATAIMEGQRFEVLVNPDSGQVLRLSRPR